MKFSKTFGIFFLTFSIGCFLVFVFAMEIVDLDYDETQHCTAFSFETKEEKTEKKSKKLEVITEDFDWYRSDDYKFKTKLLEVGEGYHGDEVKAKSGEKWLGLFEENANFVLKTTKIKIRRVSDDISDYGTNRKTGKSVSVPEKDKPMFLLKNSGLTQGKVETLFKGEKWIDSYENSDSSMDEIETFIKKDFSQTYLMNGEKYTLKVIEALNKDRENILALVLEGKGKRQFLHTVNTKFEEQVGTLFWVGDLDRDGMPDFYLTPKIHYNVVNRVLYLSSKAKGDNLVEKVAEFTTTGC